MGILKSYIKRLKGEILSESEPKEVKRRVKGFRASIQNEFTLNAQQNENGDHYDISSAESAEKRIIITIAADGTNPSYPQGEISTYTLAKNPPSMGNFNRGFVFNTCKIPHDAKWTKFELIERYHPQESGDDLPGFNKVHLRVSFKMANGVKEHFDMDGPMSEPDRLSRVNHIIRRNEHEEIIPSSDHMLLLESL